ncbi:MAG TPA: hypothetical protein VIM99_09415 [Blastocatellia bacterium]
MSQQTAKTINQAKAQAFAERMLEGLGAAGGEEKALELPAEAGFENVFVRQLSHDIINNCYVSAKR